MMQRANVDFPQPVSPTKPSVSPRRTSRLTPSTAWTTSFVRWNKPADCTGKYLTTLSMLSSTSLLDAVAPASPSTLTATSLTRRRLHAPGDQELLSELLALAHVGRKPARRQVARAGHLSERRLLHALVEGVGATRSERASLRKGDEA